MKQIFSFYHFAKFMKGENDIKIADIRLIAFLFVFDV